MAYLGWPLAGVPNTANANDFGNRIAYYPIGAMPENGTLEGIDVYIGFEDAGTQLLRVALYKGGTTPGSDINGATLVEDLGTFGPNTASEVWARIASSTNPALASGDQLIVAVKSGGTGTGTYWIPYETSDPGHDVLGWVTYTADESSSDSDAWDATISGASSTSNRWGAARIEYSAAGGNSYSLTAEQGSYTLTGQAAGLLAGGFITAETGSYTLLGSNALRDIEMNAEQGSYSVNGQDAALLGTAILTAETGLYSLIGQATNLLYSVAASIARPRGQRRLYGFRLNR